MRRAIRWLQMLGLALCLAACGNSDSGGPAPSAAPETAGQPETGASCELVMGWDPWAPYQYEIIGGLVFGLDVDLVTAIVHNAGCAVAFRKGSWRALLMQLKAGEVDLLAGATPTAERQAFAYFTDPYRDEEFLLYVARGRLPELEAKTLEQLLADGLRIGVVDDYLYGEPVSGLQDDPAYAGQFVYSTMAEINISRLLERQVDAIIEDKYVGAAIIRHKSLHESIAPHALRFGSQPVSIMVSRASVAADRFERLNQSVQQLKDNGAIDKVLAQYRNP